MFIMSKIFIWEKYNQPQTNNYIYIFVIWTFTFFGGEKKKTEIIFI